MRKLFFAVALALISLASPSAMSMVSPLTSVSTWLMPVSGLATHGARVHRHVGEQRRSLTSSSSCDGSPADDRYLVRGFRHPARRQDVYPQGEASISVVSVIRHRSTVYHTIELCSMTFTLGKTRINSVLLSLNHVIRHKPLHNIPLMQGFLQLSVILQRHIRQISQRIN